MVAVFQFMITTVYLLNKVLLGKRMCLSFS